MVRSAPNLSLSIRNRSNIRFTASKIAAENNRGSAIAARLVTVFSDLRYVQNVRNISQITAADVQQYSEQLFDRLHGEDLSPKTAENYISAINVVLQYAGKSGFKVSAKALGLSSGHRVSSDRSNSLSAHIAYLNYLQQQFRTTGNTNYLALSHSVQLQRELGLRFRESVSISAATITRALHLQTDVLNLRARGDGTKNARPRSIALSLDSIIALKSAQDFQKENGYKSLIDPNLARKAYSGWAYRTLVSFKNGTTKYADFHFHGERHEFAHQLFSSLWQQQTGKSILPPVIAGLRGADWRKYAQSKTGLNIEKVKEIDKFIRLAVSAALGHNREEITRDYLG